MDCKLSYVRGAIIGAGMALSDELAKCTFASMSEEALTNKAKNILTQKLANCSVVEDVCWDNDLFPFVKASEDLPEGYTIYARPIDNARNILCGMSAGGIFGIYRTRGWTYELVCSMYMIYGKNLTVVWADKVDWQTTMRVYQGRKAGPEVTINRPVTGQTYTICADHHMVDPPIPTMVEVLSHYKYRPFNSGSIIQDTHNVLLNGGVLQCTENAVHQDGSPLARLSTRMPIALMACLSEPVLSNEQKKELSADIVGSSGFGDACMLSILHDIENIYSAINTENII